NSGPGVLFAGENGLVLLDGESVDTGVNFNLFGGTWANGAFYVVGDKEAILQSEGVAFSHVYNLSARGVVGGGRGPMIGGTVISEDPSQSGYKSLLIRAIGPSLEAFGVENFVAR